MIKLTEIDTNLINIGQYTENIHKIFSDKKSLLGGIFSEYNINLENKLSLYLNSECVLTSNGTSAIMIGIEYALLQAKNKPIVYCVSEFLYFSIAGFLKMNSNSCIINIIKASEDEVNLEKSFYFPGHYHIFILTSHNGINCNITECASLVPENEKFIIEDRCLMFGAKEKENVNVSCYSFSNNKMISSGEGGVLCSKDTDIITWAKDRTFSGIKIKSNLKTFMYTGDYNYSNSNYPFKCSISALCSSFISVQLNSIDEIIEKRKYNYTYLLKELPSLPMIPDVPLFFPLKFQKPLSKRNINLFQYRLLKDNIMSHIGVLPYSYFEGKKLFKKFISLPIHSALSKSDLDYIITVVNKHNLTS